MDNHRPRFTLFFLDTLLILIWYIMGGGVMMSVFAIAFPNGATWFKGVGSPEQLGTATVLVFLCISAIRLATNKGFPMYTVPLAYGSTAVAYTVAIHNGLLLTPKGNFWLANAFPAFVLVLVLTGCRYVWSKIKPRRRRRRPPQARKDD